MRLQVLPNFQLDPGLDQESQQALRALLEGIKMLGRQGQGGLDGQRSTKGLDGLHACSYQRLSVGWETCCRDAGSVAPRNQVVDLATGHGQFVENRDQAPFPRGNIRGCER